MPSEAINLMENKIKVFVIVNEKGEFLNTECNYVPKLRFSFLVHSREKAEKIVRIETKRGNRAFIKETELSFE